MLPFPLRGASIVDAGSAFTHPPFAPPPGLEPRFTEPKSAVLPKLDDRRKTNRDTRAQTPTRHVNNTNNSAPTPTRQHDTRNHHTMTRANASHRNPRRNNEHKRLSGSRAPKGGAQDPHRRAHDANSADTKSWSSLLTVVDSPDGMLHLVLIKPNGPETRKAGMMFPTLYDDIATCVHKWALRCG